MDRKYYTLTNNTLDKQPMLEWERLGLKVVVTSDPYNLGLENLCGFAVRQNPKRAHLVVSKVLGKHIPVQPATIREMTKFLGEQIKVLLNTKTIKPEETVVLGYAETATGIGHNIASYLNAYSYTHSTRNTAQLCPPVLSFEEGHSHASHHFVYSKNTIYNDSKALILVDDELTTGNTIMHTIESIQKIQPKNYYIIATLLDLRDSQSKIRMKEFADSLGITIDVVSVMEAEIFFPEDIHEKAQKIIAEVAEKPALSLTSDPVKPILYTQLACPAEVALDATYGWDGEDEENAKNIIENFSEKITNMLTGENSLVLGTEEFMYVPQLVAETLPNTVYYQSTTRSPVVPIDSSDYAIRNATYLPDLAFEQEIRYVYNIKNSEYTDVFVVTRNTDRKEKMLTILAETLPTAQIHNLHFYTSSESFDE